MDFDRILKADLPFSEFTTKYPFPIDQPSPVELSATTVNIFGEECLATIGTKANTTLGLSVGPAKIRGLQYAMGSYGVVVLRLLYDDGTRSDWLGQSIRKWVATIQGKDMVSLNFMTDGFKIVSLSFGENEANRTRIIRDDESPPQLDSQSFLIDAKIARTGMRGNPFHRLVHTLPLDLQHGHANSLTVFCDFYTVRGIQLNGQAANMLGSTTTRSCPVTFYLQPGEIISFIHLIYRGERDKPPSAGPYMVAMTSKGRTLLYAPSSMVYVRERRLSKFTDVSPGFVSSIFIDRSDAGKVGEYSIGVTLQPQEPSGDKAIQRVANCPVFDHIDPQSFMKQQASYVFLSKANLLQLKLLQLQKLGDRCRGLLIHRLDDSIDILGQWDPALASTISTLYHTENGAALESITFVYADTTNPRDLR
ncbi:unnamed protein product [Clonostachys solani]|uniref:DUF7600 domain-containing protein n=1 Tax=Clonostachys solani TaxID=160281 RepID=A0A9N9ZEA7_9HYPO|nr:unnamed protein product [Clonostachys solani]